MTERDIFIGALQHTDEAGRRAYLRAACGADSALLDRVMGLLQAYEGADDFLESPALPGAGAALGPVDGVGTTIGPYTLRERIGEGGMGTVYQAEQTHPVRRTVALKVIKPGMDTRQVIARFEAERQALALMDHPNIARVLDAGATESGRPYFVMELVHGTPITDYCDRFQLAIADRVDLFILVCRAVQHAHEKGIIHRDIKPTNVLITLHDGAPVPKVIDFGVAKATGPQALTDKTLHTGFVQFVGTPLYMSPEQAESDGTDIDPRSDVYSLGVLLYELLTGVTPFDREAFGAAAPDQIRGVLRAQDPPTPSTRLASLGATRTVVSVNRQTEPQKLNRALRGELDWITMKALEKDRRRRYESAGAFAQDLQRFRADQPVAAGPPSAWYRLRKFSRRRRRALTAAAVALVAVATVLGVWAWATVRLRRAERAIELSKIEARRSRDEARHRRYAADLRQAYQFIRDGQGARALALLRKHRPGPAEDDLREFAWYYLRRLCHNERHTLRGHQGAVYHARFAPDGRTIATCGRDGTVRFWDVASGRCLRTLHAHAAEVNGVAFSPDGRRFATVGDDGAIKLWDARDFTQQATIPAHAGDVILILFTPDGRRLISGGRNDGLAKLWDVATQRELASVRANDGALEGLALSPDGTTLASVGGDGCARVWDVADFRDPRIVFAQGVSLYGVAFSADGTRLAIAGMLQDVRVFDVRSGRPRERFRAQGHHEDVQSVAFGAGDRVVVSAGADAAVRLWDAASGRSLGALLGHTDKVWGVSVSPDGALLASASSDGTVKLWDARPAQDRLALLPAGGHGLQDLAFAPDGRTLIVLRALDRPTFTPKDANRQADTAIEAVGLDAATGSPRFERRLALGQESTGVFLTADATTAVVEGPSGRAAAWDVASGTRRELLPQGQSQPYPRGRLVAVWRPGQPVVLVDSATGREQRALAGTEALRFPGTFAPGRKALVAWDRRFHLHHWEAVTGRPRPFPPGLPNWGGGAAFSPDETLFALGDGASAIQLWDARTWQPLETLAGHSNHIETLAFSPDGRALVSGGRDGTVRLWSVAAREELLTLRVPCFKIGAIRFSPDGRTLAFGVPAEEGQPGVYLLPTVLPEDLGPEEGP